MRVQTLRGGYLLIKCNWMSTEKIYLVTMEYGESQFAQPFKTIESAYKYINDIANIANDVAKEVVKTKSTLQIKISEDSGCDICVLVKTIATNKLKYVLTRCEYGTSYGEMKAFGTQDDAINFVHCIQNEMSCRVDKLQDSKGYWEFPDGSSYRLFVFLYGKRDSDNLLYNTLDVSENASDSEVNKALGRKIQQIYAYGSRKERDAVKAWVAYRNICNLRKSKKDSGQVLEMYALIDFKTWFFLSVYACNVIDEAKKKCNPDRSNQLGGTQEESNGVSTMLGFLVTIAWFGFLVFGIVNGWWWIWFGVAFSVYGIVRASRNS